MTVDQNTSLTKMQIFSGSCKPTQPQDSFSSCESSTGDGQRIKKISILCRTVYSIVPHRDMAPLLGGTFRYHRSSERERAMGHYHLTNQAWSFWYWYICQLQLG